MVCARELRAGTERALPAYLSNDLALLPTHPPAYLIQTISPFGKASFRLCMSVTNVTLKLQESRKKDMKQSGLSA
jgi:hypothetical protein